MKINTLLLTTIVSSSLALKAQTWGNILNTAKDVAVYIETFKGGKINV
jgi:ABC-type uncharacterized transport system YnjBCD substrate-binding protein